MKFFYDFISTPIGTLYLQTSRDKLLRIQHTLPEFFSKNDSNLPIINETKKWIDSYFDKKLSLPTPPLSFKGTPFQINVLKLISNIPFGSYLSYADLADLAQSPYAYRAVGSVCRYNPIPLIIPCHRVLGKNAPLHYSLGGPQNKLQLLQHENTSSKLTH